MLGELIATFCERSEMRHLKAIELWAYPDGTLNCVVSRCGSRVSLESAFPCHSSQLQGIMEGRSIRLENEEGCVIIERTGARICARFSGFGEAWCQCIDVDSFAEAVAYASRDRMILLV
jgi:hypothetical protein